MSSSEGKQSTLRKPIPRVADTVVTQMVDIPLPQKSKNGEVIKQGILKLEVGGAGMVVTLTKERSFIEWHRYISSICSNLKKKTDGAMVFTVCALETDEIGVWRIK